MAEFCCIRKYQALILILCLGALCLLDAQRQHTDTFLSSLLTSRQETIN